MWIEGINTVFIHVPKTAGNYVQSVFIKARLTKEVKELQAAHQDGFHRFAVVGDKTSNKHQNLVDYQKRFDRKQWRALNFLSVWRNPRDRLISLYLSPHLHLNSSGVVVPPTRFDLEEFKDVVKSYPSATQKLRTRTRRLPKRLTLINFESVRDDLESYLRSHGHEISAPLEVRNPTSSRELFDQMKEDDRIFRVVRRSHHMADFDLPLR